MNLDFNKGQGLVPAIIQHAENLEVLMLGYMNEEALKRTQDSGEVHFWSRSRQEIWRKGETSGNVLKVLDIQRDCDKDTLLIAAQPAGPVCHTGSDTCFKAKAKGHFLKELEGIIEQRRTSSAGQSYTASLFEKGVNKIAQKVGEEATELVIEAMDDNDDRFVSEAADLMFHYMVLLAHRGVSLEQIEEELRSRHRSSQSS